MLENFRANVLKHLCSTSIDIMGRGRKGLLKQSQKKPNITKDEKKRGEPRWWYFDRPNYYENKNSLFSPEDFVDAVRQMNPQEVANILFSNVNSGDTANSGSCFHEHEIS